MPTDGEKLGVVLASFAKSPSFFKGSGSKGGFGKSANILSQHRMWSDISKVKPSLSWTKPEALEAMTVVLKERKDTWKDFSDEDEVDWLKKMPNRFKFVCRAINQARLKKSNKWVNKLCLATSDGGAAAEAADCEDDDDELDGECEGEEEENEELDEDEVPLSQLSSDKVAGMGSDVQAPTDSDGAPEVGAETHADQRGPREGVRVGVGKWGRGLRDDGWQRGEA